MDVGAAWRRYRQGSRASVARSIAATIVAFVVFGASYWLLNTALVWGVFKAQDLLGVHRGFDWYYYAPLAFTALVIPSLSVPISSAATTAIFNRWDRVFIVVALLGLSLWAVIGFLLTRPFNVGDLVVNIAAMVGIWVALPHYERRG